jgi:hypothetical protein
LRVDKDLVVAITGNEGGGKTSLALGLSLEGDSKFNMLKNVLYSPTTDEMEEKIQGLPAFSFIVADEAMKAMYKLNWHTKQQRYLNEFFALCRKENKCSILCLPRFIDLGEYFRHHRVKLWIHIIEEISLEKKTGTAVVFSPSWSPFTTDPWWFKMNQKLIEEYAWKNRLKEVEFSLEDKKEILGKSKNFVDFLEFGWIDDALWQQYLGEKAKVGRKIDGEFVESKESLLLNKERAMTAKLVEICKSKGMSESEINKELGKSVSFLSWRKTHPLMID